MQALIETATNALSVLENNNATKPELAHAAKLLSDAVKEAGDRPDSEIADYVNKARRFVAQEGSLLIRTIHLEDGRIVADAPDGNRWTKGAPTRPGTYWFLVPFVDKLNGAAVYKGFYKEFEFERGVSLDKYGHVSEKELEELWHLPLLMPEIPVAVAFRAEARGALVRATTCQEALRIRDGVDDE